MASAAAHAARPIRPDSRAHAARPPPPPRGAVRARAGRASAGRPACRPRRSAWLIIARPPAPAVFGWGKKGGGGQASTKCEKCGAELYYAERLERHMKKAHGNVPAKKPDAQGGDGGLW